MKKLYIIIASIVIFLSLVSGALLIFYKSSLGAVSKVSEEVEFEVMDYQT